MAEVLIIEDEPDARQMLALLMQREGHRTIEVANGWEALIATGEQHFDLILLDLMMPGLDGAKFLQILRKSIKDGNVPVVVVTALDSEVAQTKIGNSHVDAIVVKRPAQMINDLLKTVRLILGGLDGVDGPLK